LISRADQWLLLHDSRAERDKQLKALLSIKRFITIGTVVVFILYSMLIYFGRNNFKLEPYYKTLLENVK
jgi:hypothetical protein